MHKKPQEGIGAYSQGDGMGETPEISRSFLRRRFIQITTAMVLLQYCIDGTEGQKKIRYTLLENRINFPADGSTDLPRDMLRRYRQVILHKRCVDPFEEPRIDRLLSEVRANEFILVGASIEGAVMATALGLLQRGKRVSVVVDAVGSHNKREARLALRKMEAKGAKLIETKRLAGTSHLRHGWDMRLQKLPGIGEQNTA